MYLPARITDSLRTLAPSRVKLADFRPVEEEKRKKETHLRAFGFLPCRCLCFCVAVSWNQKPDRQRTKKKREVRFFCNLAMRNRVGRVGSKKILQTAVRVV